MAEPDPNAPTLFDLDAPATRFMDLEAPEYAYMFGFLQADGHLARGTGQKGKLTVEINARDAHILGEFQRLTPYYSSITDRVRSTNFAEQHHSATWSLCALEARTIVNELGIPYGKKSHTIKPPRVEFSRPDYIRGLIDADGSLGWTERDDRELLRLGNPVSAATALDRTEQSCAMRLWRLRTGQTPMPAA